MYKCLYCDSPIATSDHLEGCPGEHGLGFEEACRRRELWHAGLHDARMLQGKHKGASAWMQPSYKLGYRAGCGETEKEKTKAA